MLDTIFWTGANPNTGFFSFNTCDFGSNCTATFIDNYELYEISTDTTLADLTVNGSTVASFDSATFSYDVELPNGTTDVPVVAAVAGNANATVVVTQAAELPGAASILVTAEDDSSTATYVINFTVAP